MYCIENRSEYPGSPYVTRKILVDNFCLISLSVYSFIRSCVCAVEVLHFAPIAWYFVLDVLPHSFALIHARCRSPSRSLPIVAVARTEICAERSIHTVFVSRSLSLPSLCWSLLRENVWQLFSAAAPVASSAFFSSRFHFIYCLRCAFSLSLGCFLPFCFTIFLPVVRNAVIQCMRYFCLNFGPKWCPDDVKPFKLAVCAASKEDKHTPREMCLRCGCECMLSSCRNQVNQFTRHFFKMP